MQLFRVAWVMGVFAATVPAYAGTITVNSTAAPSAGFCTLGQAIYAANLANNPTDATPAGATTIAPLSDSVAVSSQRRAGRALQRGGFLIRIGLSR